MMCTYIISVLNALMLRIFQQPHAFMSRRISNLVLLKSIKKRIWNTNQCRRSIIHTRPVRPGRLLFSTHSGCF
jgi:hypothetical protein